MIQAARSGRQNIAEGSAAGATSAETEIKLINVARASLQELLLDYEDYLRVRNLIKWDVNSEKAVITRRVCSNHNDSVYYSEAIRHRSDETIANIAITLIHQTDVFLRKLLDRRGGFPAPGRHKGADASGARQLQATIKKGTAEPAVSFFIEDFYLSDFTFTSITFESSAATTL